MRHNLLSILKYEFAGEEMFFEIIFQLLELETASRIVQVDGTFRTSDCRGEFPSGGMAFFLYREMVTNRYYSFIFRLGSLVLLETCVQSGGISGGVTVDSDAALHLPPAQTQFDVLPPIARVEAEEILADRIEIESVKMLVEVARDLRTWIELDLMRQVAGDTLLAEVIYHPELLREEFELLFESSPGCTQYRLARTLFEKVDPQPIQNPGQYIPRSPTRE